MLARLEPPPPPLTDPCPSPWLHCWYWAVEGPRVLESNTLRARHPIASCPIPRYFRRYHAFCQSLYIFFACQLTLPCKFKQIYIVFLFDNFFKKFFFLLLKRWNEFEILAATTGAWCSLSVSRRESVYWHFLSLLEKSVKNQLSHPCCFISQY